MFHSFITNFLIANNRCEFLSKMHDTQCYIIVVIVLCLLLWWWCKPCAKENFHRHRRHHRRHHRRYWGGSRYGAGYNRAYAYANAMETIRNMNNPYYHPVYPSYRDGTYIYVDNQSDDPVQVIVYHGSRVVAQQNIGSRTKGPVSIPYVKSRGMGIQFCPFGKPCSQNRHSVFHGQTYTLTDINDQFSVQMTPTF